MTHSTKKILLIEDDLVDAMAFKKALREIKVKNELIHLTHAEEALNHSEQADIGIIFLDLNMPKMNGVEFLLERNKSRSLTSNLIFVLTTSTNDSDIRNCYELGISGYLVKPVDYDEFKSLLKSVFSFWNNSQLPK